VKLVRDHHQEPREPSSAPPPEPGGFEDVYAQHVAFVWRCLRGLGVPHAALDDATQDVFLAVHRQLAQFRGEASIRTWIYGIARRVASNHRRSDRRKLAPLEPLQPDAMSPDPGPLQRAADAQAASFVEQFMSKLDTKKREVFLLAMVEEMTIPEVATALSIPLNTAYSRLRRARAEFQRALERHQHAAR
jgi:RNA polymerase sigma-70 factor (ECF subfamily)